MGRTLLVLLASLLVGCVPAPRTVAASPTLPPTATRNGYFINLDTIPQVSCVVIPKDMKISDPNKITPEQLAKITTYSGSGTIIGRDRVLTAWHVVNEGICMIGPSRGIAMTRAKIVSFDAKLDIAVLQADLGDTAIAHISCEAFKTQRPYFALGYPQAQDFAVQVVWFKGVYRDEVLQEGALVRKIPHMGEFAAQVFPGMSGGPVIGTDGAVTGIINAAGTNEAAFRDLKDTPLCAALAAKAP